MRSHRQALAEGHDFPLLIGDLRVGSQVIGQFGLISSNKNDHSLPPTPRRQAVDTVFLSSSSLSPFFIFKENSRPAEGAQLRRSLAAQCTQQGAAGPRNPFLGKALAAGHILTLPGRPRGSSSGASRRNSRYLVRRRKDPALIPNSENHIATQTRDTDAVAVTGFPTARPLNPRRARSLGSPSCSAIPQAGLRMMRRSGRGFQTSKGHRRSESFSFEPLGQPCRLCLGAVSGPRQPLRKTSRSSREKGEDPVAIIVYHTPLSTLSPIFTPNSENCKTRVREKQLNV